MARPMLNENTMSKPDADEDCFSALRRLACNVDTGVSLVQARVETLDDDSIDQLSSETPALLFLQHAHKDMQEIRSGAKKIHKDFKMRSSTISSMGDLFAGVLESFQERLEIVETFIEKYGYIRPLPPSPQSNSESDDVNEIQEVTDTTISKEIKDNCRDHEKMNESSDPQTPKLEDIGLSEDTLFDLKAGKYILAEKTPVSNKTNHDYQTYEILTPKLESYGLSEHTLMFLDDNYHGKNTSNSSTPITRQSHQNWSSKKRSPVGMLSPLDYISYQNENQDPIDKFEKATNVMSDSPKTPPLPELTTHFFIDPPKIEQPIAIGRFGCDSPKTPPLPDFQTLVLTELDLPKRHQSTNQKIHSSLTSPEKTPPYPKLSSRYF